MSFCNEYEVFNRFTFDVPSQRSNRGTRGSQGAIRLNGRQKVPGRGKRWISRGSVTHLGHFSSPSEKPDVPPTRVRDRIKVTPSLLGPSGTYTSITHVYKHSGVCKRKEGCPARDGQIYTYSPRGLKVEDEDET